MSAVGDRQPADSSLVLRTLTVILLTGGSLLAAVREPVGMFDTMYMAGLLLLWGSLVLELVPRRGWLSRRYADTVLVFLDIVAVAMIVASVPDIPGVAVFFLGPVATATVRLGREGATAAAALAALCLLLPAMIGSGSLQPVSPATGVGAVLLLTSGLAAGEIVRLVDRRRRQEHRSAERARRVGREMRMILDNLGSGLLTVDASGEVTRVNPAAARILGLGDGTYSQVPLPEVLGTAGADLAEVMLISLADGEPRKRQEVMVARGSVPVPLGVNVDVLADEDGGLAGVVAIFSDLSEVRRLQEHLRRADRLAGVGELAASIAHELRNPLASIRGSVELLAGELDVRDEQAQLMQLILRESNRLNTIITDFLEFARVRPPQRRQIDLDRFLVDLQLQLRQHAAANGGGVEVNCECGQSGCVIDADPEQLLQAILNLAINACEAMHGQGRLSVRADVVDDAFVVRLMDSGPGLSPEKLEDIFTPFVTSKPNGTGLGLPMVARIVHSHGGTIEAVNNSSGGAEFVMRFPFTADTSCKDKTVDAGTNDIGVAVH